MALCDWHSAVPYNTPLVWYAQFIFYNANKQLHKYFLTGGDVLLIRCKPFMLIATNTDRSMMPKILETKEPLFSICPLNKTDLEIISKISAYIHNYINYKLVYVDM